MLAATSGHLLREGDVGVEAAAKRAPATGILDVDVAPGIGAVEVADLERHRASPLQADPGERTRSAKSRSCGPASQVKQRPAGAGLPKCLAGGGDQPPGAAAGDAAMTQIFALPASGRACRPRPGPSATTTKILAGPSACETTKE